MPAAQYDITIEQGATFLLDLLWKDSNGTPVDLTGYAARMQVRRKYDAPDPALLSFTDANGAITLGGAAGTIAIKGLATLTDVVPAKQGVYDLELVAPNGDVTRLVAGIVIVTPEVTR